MCTGSSRKASLVSPQGELSFRLTHTLTGCQKDDSTAWQDFIALFGLLAQRALRTFRLWPIEFEEVVSTVRVNLVLAISRGRFREMDGDPLLYMSAALRNGARDALRRRQLQSTVAPIESPSPSPSDVAESNDLLRRVQAIIRTWKEADRSLFIAKVGGVRSAIIKEQLERDFNLRMSIGAVDVRFNRLRQILRTQCKVTRPAFFRKRAPGDQVTSPC